MRDLSIRIIQRFRHQYNICQEQMEQFLANAEEIAADPPVPAAAAAAAGGSDGEEGGGESAAGAAAAAGSDVDGDADDEAAVSLILKCFLGVGVTE